ncbi:MAG: ATP phosphoribosyltransferase regulatory subunit [Verrucomicrobia bacterium]|jgi:histidyl-tRNA synthetase|nr:ATP phosphoribosyltransferase regulatory subunit [Verrucomicrobiota bacterium]OQC65900.1 MAG: Histidine--tRNA ligase [Verrucomicrobia bacterium ADurb.Bin006]MDI9381390.1 ATP phosphoribosyltransferase regulatory subunit [Verrucomicrobiota bacterium]NMD21608.1 histidine--tRNA ligase [Verrucomicrobiota bacterium]HOA62359.1 ATP phosphoribosyltransferase regulatory subunit [Verrucomicrobiota bacterium]
MDRIPGFRDFYPEPLPTTDVWSADLRRFIFERWADVARRYGFREYDGPPLEPLELYTTKSGAEIVSQLYNFIDKGGREVAMRPEMTPTLARMASAQERQYKKPIKWYAIPQLFRYERQQKGRLREHFQFNADIVGEAEPAADAELIALLIDSLRALGLTASDFVVRLSSRNAWQDFFSRHCSESSRACEFYQVIDKLEREPPEVSAAKLDALGFALDDVQAFITAGRPTDELRSILDNLAARGLGAFVKVDYGVIRGLDYYTGPVFEAFDLKGEFRAIAGGGRYDNLIKIMSGGRVDLPALGFGMGDVVLAELLKARGLTPDAKPRLAAFVVIENEALRADSLALIQRLRDANSSVDYTLVPARSDKQFKRALELGARTTVRLERTPSGDLIAKVKDLATRIERAVAPDDVAGTVANVEDSHRSMQSAHSAQSDLRAEL